MKRAAKIKSSTKPTLQQQLEQAQACLQNPDKIAEGMALFENLLQKIQHKSDKDSLEMKENCLEQISFFYYRHDDLENCAIYMERFIEHFPDRTDFMAQVFDVYLKLDNLEKANKWLNKLKQKKAHVKILAHSYNQLLTYLYIKGAYNKIIPDEEKLKETLEFLLKHDYPQAQLSYDKFRITQLTNEEKLEEAYTLALKYCKNESPPFKLFALYICGFCTHRLGKNIQMAIQFFEKYMKVYEENKKTLEPQDTKNYSAVAYTLAKIYDGDNDSSFSDSEKEIEYLTISANLGYAKSHHDLGYIYEHGEVCAVDLDKAITHYSTAVELGNASSNLNLGIVLNARNQDGDNEKAIACLELALQVPIPEIKLKTIMQFGMHYLNLADTYTKPEEIQQKQAAEKKSYDFFMLANEMKCAQAAGNLGYFHYLGFGVEKNFAKAKDYFEIAEAGGIKINDHEFASVYVAVINAENDLEARNTLIQTFVKRFGDSTEFIIELYNKIRHQESIATNKQILSTANDVTLDSISRIDKILDFHLERMNTVNVCTLLHRLGNLVDKSLNHRDFHQKNLPRILPLIVNAHERLLASRFQNTYYVTLVEGLSKLYLTVEIEPYKNILEALYKKAVVDIEKLTPVSICNLIVAATRLDPDLEIRTELRVLIKKSLLNLKNLDDWSLANFIYAAIVLSMKSTFGLSTSDYQPLIREASSVLARTFNFLTMSQISQALNYCYQRKIFRSSIDKSLLDNVTLQIENSPSDVTVSGLQREILGYLSILFPKISVEKKIDVYSVDALIETSADKKFILQVDGPSHFLHGINTMKENNRTLFRDKYLSHYHPVFSISYKHWRALKSFSEIKDFLTMRLNALGIELSPAKELPRYKSIHGFFNQKPIQKTTLPVGLAVPGLN